MIFPIGHTKRKLPIISLNSENNLRITSKQHMGIVLTLTCRWYHATCSLYSMYECNRNHLTMLGKWKIIKANSILHADIECSRLTLSDLMETIVFSRTSFAESICSQRNVFCLRLVMSAQQYLNQIGSYVLHILFSQLTCYKRSQIQNARLHLPVLERQMPNGRHHLCSSFE